MDVLPTTIGDNPAEAVEYLYSLVNDTNIPENVTKIFFDNESHNLLDVKRMYPEIHCVLIDHNIHNALATNVNDYNKLFTGNEYVGKIQTKDEGIVQPVEGISLKTHLPALETWLNNPTNKEIIFDWDRTLSVMEGFFMIPQASVNIHMHVALYLMGGQARFEALKTFFAQCLSKKVNIIILTNNPMAELEKDTRVFFLTVIKQIIPGFSDNNLLYAGGYIVKWITKDDGKDVISKVPNNKGLTLLTYYNAKYKAEQQAAAVKGTSHVGGKPILHAKQKNTNAQRLDNFPDHTFCPRGLKSSASGSRIGTHRSNGVLRNKQKRRRTKRTRRMRSNGVLRKSRINLRG